MGGVIPEEQRRFKLIQTSDQIRELQTILRERNTSSSDFVFYADRLIRLVVEEGLNELPFTHCTIKTPTGHEYEGIRFTKGNCGVSICRSGEAMEKGLRECCRSIRIGKILIDSDPQTRDARVLYARLIPDIVKRRVLLLYPIMRNLFLGSGNTVAKAIAVLKENGVPDNNIFLVTLFTTPQALTNVQNKYPRVTVLTTEVHSTIPTHFGQKYFGTD